jgi:hypothetical protein
VSQAPLPQPPTWAQIQHPQPPSTPVARPAPAWVPTQADPHQDVAAWQEPARADRSTPGKGLAPVLFVIAGKGGVGKSQPLDAPIPVPVCERFPDGWARMGTLDLGDLVYTPAGKTARIDFFSPIEERTVFEVLTDDGQRVRASDHHLWEIVTAGGELRIVETTGLKPGMGIRLALPIPGESDGDDIAWRPGMAIPPAILRASISRRRQTWRDLIESTHARVVEEPPSLKLALRLSPDVADSAIELSRSLGFHTTRTRDGMVVRPDARVLTVRQVRNIGTQQVRCLRVDDPAHMYLTAGFVPTHNTTVSRHIAEHASTQGIHSVLVDGNAGQGDQRTFLRLTGSSLPSVFDVGAGTVQPEEAILFPGTVNAARPRLLSPIHFALVLAPPLADNDRGIVTPQVYRKVIEQARATTGVGLVVVDTQITEASDVKDPNQVAGGLVVPMMREDNAWALGTTEWSDISVKNLLLVIDQMLRSGCPRERILTAVTKLDADRRLSAKEVSVLGEDAHFVGVSQFAPDLFGRASAGYIDVANPALSVITERVIKEVTGKDVGMPEHDQPHRTHWWNRAFGGRK